MSSQFWMFLFIQRLQLGSGSDMLCKLWFHCTDCRNDIDIHFHRCFHRFQIHRRFLLENRRCFHAHDLKKNLNQVKWVNDPKIWPQTLKKNLNQIKWVNDPKICFNSYSLQVQLLLPVTWPSQQLLPPTDPTVLPSFWNFEFLNWLFLIGWLRTDVGIGILCPF